MEPAQPILTAASAYTVTLGSLFLDYVPLISVTTGILLLAAMFSSWVVERGRRRSGQPAPPQPWRTRINHWTDTVNLVLGSAVLLYPIPQAAQFYRPALSAQSQAIHQDRLLLPKIGPQKFLVQIGTQPYQLVSTGPDAVCAWAALRWPELGASLRTEEQVLVPNPQWQVLNLTPPGNHEWAFAGCRHDVQGMYARVKLFPVQVMPGDNQVQAIR